MLLRAGAVVAIAFAVALTGCTGGSGGGLGFNKATLSDPSFGLDPESGEKDTLFKVDSRGLGDKYNVTWDWGDGTFSYGGAAEHKYGFTNGILLVTMIATSAEGDQGIATREIKLGNGLNKVPTVTARAQRTWIEVGQRTNLTATGNDADRDPLTYFWSYTAPGSPAETTLDTTANRAPVEFAEPGVYDVKVRARDPKGGEALANVTITVSRDIPDTRFEQIFNGTIVAGSGGAGASEKGWLVGQTAGAPVPDTNADSVRHRYTLLYPAYTLIFLTWNDTSTQGAIDLDLELRHASNGTVIFTSATRAPAPAFEFNLTKQEPGDYDVVIRGVVAANVAYTALVQATLQVTPELVLAAEGA